LNQARVGLQRRAPKPAVTLDQDRLGEVGSDLRGVVGRDARGVGVAAVENELYGRDPAGAEVVGEAAVDSQHHLGAPSIDELARPPHGLDVLDHLEVSGRHEAAHQLATRHAVVEVVNGGRYVFHVRGHRVAEDHGLDHRNHEDDSPHPPVAEYLEELLHQHPVDSLKHGAGPSHGLQRS